MPFEPVFTKPGTCPICGLPRPASEQITCAKCWHHVLNGKDRQELAAMHRRKQPTDAKCAKIVRRIVDSAERRGMLHTAVAGGRTREQHREMDEVRTAIVEGGI